MQDKKNFGKYIAEKRKKANLTQEALATKLYVIPTTISKWERGISYPDITMITNLCKELNISEHEFFTACDDEAISKEKKEIQKYRKLKRWLFNIVNIGYLLGIITCFICNLIIDRKLSWFLIVLVGTLISFSITSLPFYLKNNKYKWLKTTTIVTILVYLLLFVINYVNHSNWLLSSYLIASFALVFLWIVVLLWTFIKTAVSYKMAISLLILAFVTTFSNSICAKALNIPNNDSNYPNIICSVIMVVSSLVIILKQGMSKTD